MQQTPGGKAGAETIADLKRRIVELEQANRSPAARPQRGLWKFGQGATW
ncbi:MAG: hypothetical protein ABIR36_11160 [Nitrospiraceae bacterium]